MSAFVPGARVRVAATSSGPLDGLRFAVKDLIDVAGVVTGGGNPDWLATHAEATRHAPSVAALLAAGASVDGKTITDELAYSLEGVNEHYGTPLNPRWPHALPGGSSSGSASAVASGEVDFALGTDTGGSVRVPAAFCGLWGIRPTHDAVSAEGVLPFAPCFDTVGWFARSGELLARVADVLLAGTAPVDVPPHMTRCSEAFGARAANEPDEAATLASLAASVGAHDEISVFHGDAARWLHCYQQLQDDAIRASLGGWIDATSPRFGPAIASRFARLALLDDDEVARCRALRSTLAARIDALVSKSVIVLPTTPLALIEKNASGERIGAFYRDALTMDAIAALAGLPQVTVPLADERDRPLALSFIGPRGSDRALIALVRHLFSSIE
ncbi:MULTISPECIES: amidase [unclassified Caballeronia]|uniref:amidase n=1 Tax=unclassified Caballeronia TaxID=2646786 RepID=UPI0028637D18|nr:MULTISPECIES: amidase [unclassified Caballeronia]MDR5752990.1 amidase [Caballeronia sp. LZ024]MDR5841277.1 amidase [Caballeronia sp. LZ031]